MFTYFFSLAIIAFEVICCKIFFESFCDSSGENRKYKRIILLVLLIAIYERLHSLKKKIEIEDVEQQ